MLRYIVACALLPAALERNSISRAAFERELRVHDLRSLADVDEARLEPTGRISFVRRHGGE